MGSTRYSLRVIEGLTRVLVGSHVVYTGKGFEDVLCQGEPEVLFAEACMRHRAAVIREGREVVSATYRTRRHAPLDLGIETPNGLLRRKEALEHHLTPRLVTATRTPSSCVEIPVVSTIAPP